jgi:ribonucleotide reductase alpha subunit
VKVSSNARTVLEKRYLKKVDGKVVETPEDMLRRVSRNIAEFELLYGASASDVEALAERFFEVMDELDFMPNSPTLMNAGRDLQQLSACFVLPIEDSMESIFESVKNMAVIQKSGGGTGFSFSRLRPKCDQVKSTGGVASGPISFLKVFNASTDAIKQGGTRRGANMGILRFDHPDIMEFITCKENNADITNFNISVGITEEFMRKAEADEEYDLINPRDGSVSGSLRAKEVFQKIVEGAWRNGEPGIVFMDRLNRDNPTPLLGDIESTNPCVTGDTLVSTDKGLLRAGSLRPGMRIITPEGPRPITRVINNGVQQVYRIRTTSGLELRVTGDHKFRVTGRGWVPASQLRAGDGLEVLAGTGSSSSSSLPPGVNVMGLRERNGFCLPLENCEEYGFMLGLVADGKHHSGQAHLAFGSDQRHLLERALAILKAWGVDCSTRQVGRTTVLTAPGSLGKVWKAFGAGSQGVPSAVLSAPRDVQRAFVEALFQYMGWRDGQGHLHLSGAPSFLSDLKTLLTVLGVRSSMSAFTSEGVMVEGGVSLVDRTCHMLVPGGDLGGLSEPEVWVDALESVDPDGEEEVFDVTEPETLTWVTNGIISLDCGEQPLLPYESCFAAETRILTEEGWERIEDAYQRQCSGQAIQVQTDQRLGEGEAPALKPATLVRVGEREVMRLELQNGLTLRATPDHRVLTERGWVPIEELTGEDQVIILSQACPAGIAGESWSGDTGQGVPSAVMTAPQSQQAAYLRSLFQLRGSVSQHRGTVSLRTDSEEMARDIQLLLLGLGIDSSVKSHGTSRRRRHIQITLAGMQAFLNAVGFPDSRAGQVEAWLNSTRRKRSQKGKSQVRSVVNDGRTVVYDASEPVTHSLIAQGMVAHNCNLGSINLARMVDMPGEKPAVDYRKLGEIVSLAVRFLDDVIDANRYPLPVIEENTKGNRKIGLGVMGFADMLILLGIPYDSEEALQLAEDIMRFIQEEGVKASRELARERGPFPNFPGSVFDEKAEPPIRNATTTTVAPTGTISIIAGCSSGIEPLFAVAFTRRVLDGEELVETHPRFEEIAVQRGFFSQELMKMVATHGSVQGIPEVPGDVKRLFMTALDIDPEWHVRMQAAFQKYTHNAVSKTINLRHSASVEDVAKIYRMAYELGCKGLTVFRTGSRESQVLNVGPKKEQPKEIEPRPRPQVTCGRTERVRTGCGNLYVTINEDSMGLCEVFASMGKSGGCAASQSEAVARLVSIALRSGVKPESIIKELRGIRCPSPSWQNGGMVLSCADALGIVMADYLNDGRPPDNPHEFFVASSDQLQYHMGACPECGGHVRHEAGCVTCVFCGYSKC